MERTTPPPVFLFDGDCAFCSSTARWAERRVRVPVPFRAWQHTDLATLGVEQAEVEAAVVLVSGDGRRRAGPDAIAHLLGDSGSRWWRAVGKLLGLAPVAALARPVYRLVARNRHRLPGGTPECSLPQDRRHRRAT